MKSRKVTPPKPKQIDETNIKTLVLLAKAEGHITEQSIATWIISVSETWKNKGYHEIMKEMKK